MKLLMIAMSILCYCILQSLLHLSFIIFFSCCHLLKQSNIHSNNNPIRHSIPIISHFFPPIFTSLKIYFFLKISLSHYIILFRVLLINALNILTKKNGNSLLIRNHYKLKSLIRMWVLLHFKGCKDRRKKMWNNRNWMTNRVVVWMYVWLFE